MIERVERGYSPFPGMDPYLEAYDVFPDFHNTLASVIRAELNAVLPPRYFAWIQKRPELGIILEAGSLHRIIPDVTVLHRPVREPASAWTVQAPVIERPRSEPSAGTRLQIRTDPLDHLWVEIRDSKRGHKVVTVIEIASPANKQPSPDRKAYEGKQAEVLGSDAHLIELDLLRYGRRLLPYPELELWHDATRPDYLVVLNRANLRTNSETDYILYPTSIRGSLPCIPVPLTGDDPDVLLDLQVAMNRSYREGAYPRALDYTLAPEPPLGEEDAAWADALLREAGFRVAAVSTS